jgi:hypothetical protein
MADWSGTARSNYFEVKDFAAFKTWLESHSLSLLEDDAEPSKPSTKVGFTAANTDHGAWPSSIWNEETDEYEEFDLVSELWQHLVEGQVAVLMEVGSERYRYVTGQAIAVRWDGRVVHLSLNDIYEKAAREFGVDVKSITPAEY